VDRCNIIKKTLDEILAESSVSMVISTTLYRSLQRAFVASLPGFSTREGYTPELEELRQGIDCDVFCRILSENNIPILATPEVFRTFDVDLILTLNCHILTRIFTPGIKWV
jgi:hypothetical protein